MNHPITRLRHIIREKAICIKQKYCADFIFIHINRTAGHSIGKALGCPFEHKTALEKIQELGRESWDAKFTFAFVRNPWDKAVSHYHYRIATNQTGLQTNPISFAEWIKLAYDLHDPRYYDKEKYFMPQLKWLRDNQGKILVNFIGRFEQLEGDFASLCKTLNRTASLPHIGRTERTHYRDYYDRASQEIIGRCFKEDIEYFEYRY